MEKLKPKTILYVEDEAVIALAESRLLKGFGYSVVVANSGEEAIEIVSGNSEIDLILMDIDLGPGIDGTEAARIILQNHDVPVVFLSGHTEPEIVEKTEKIPSYGYILKNSCGTILNASIKTAFTLFEANRRTKDVPDLMVAENALKDLDRLNRQVIQNADVGIVVLDRDLRYQVWNPFMESLSGLSASEVLGKKPLELFPFLRDSKVISAFEKALEGVATVSEEISFFIPKTGKSGWSKNTSRPLKNADGEIVGVLEIVRDITEQKINNNVLLQSQSLLKEMGRIAKIGAWKIDVKTQQVERTEEIYKIFEIDPASRPPSEELIDSYYTPASLRLRQQTVRHTMETGEPFDIEAEIVSAKGNRRWMRIIGNALIAGGEITHRIGITQDITEQKRIAEAQYESELRYRALFNSIRDAISVSNRDREIIDCNQAFIDLFGYSLSEVKGKNASILYDSREDYESTGKLIQSHVGEEPLLVQINYRKKSGEVFISENLIQNLNNTEGKPVGFIGLIRDITFRKEAEKKIMILLKEKELLLKEVHHRIKNNMNTMMSLLSLQANEAKSPETASALNDARNRFQSMGILYDKLYRTEYPHEMPLKVYLSPLVDEIIHMFPNSPHVKIEKHLDDFNLGIKELSSLGIMVNELLTNTMKYAFTGRDGGIITVSALKIGSRVSITIGDNGIGLPDSIDMKNSKGFGLKLVATLIKQMNGTIHILRERGTEFVVEFDAV